MISLEFVKRLFERSLKRSGYKKMPMKVSEFIRGPVLGFSNLGSARTQLEAYQGHVYKCVTLIYRQACSIPMRLYKQRGDRKEVIKRHPFLDLMRKPNSLMSGNDLKAITFMHRDLTGKAFWLKVLDGFGRPRELWPLPVADFRGFILDDSKTKIVKFEFKPDGGQSTLYNVDEVVYFRYPHPVYYLDGASPIQSQAFAYDTDRAMKVYQKKFFQNSARPDIVFETDQEIQEEDARRLLLSWKQAHQGVERAWEPAILDKGLRVKNISVSMEDLAFASLAEWSKEDILEAYNIPEGKFGTAKNVKYENDYGIDVTFNSECIAPRLRSYEEEITTSLLNHYDEGLFVEHDNCVPSDKEFELKRRESNLKSFTTTINEEREKMGLPPVAWGHTPWMTIHSQQVPVKGKRGDR